MNIIKLIKLIIVATVFVAITATIAGCSTPKRMLWDELSPQEKAAIVRQTTVPKPQDQIKGPVPYRFSSVAHEYCPHHHGHPPMAIK